MNYIKKIFFQVLFLLLFISNVAFASQSDYNFGKAVFKLIIYTAIIIVVLFITIYGTRFIAKNTKRFAASKHMKLIDVLNFGTNNKILMIEISDYIYIIAISNNSTELIDKLPKDKVLSKGEFEEYLNRHNMNYKNINKISANIKNIINQANKSNSKEEKENEE